MKNKVMPLICQKPLKEIPSRLMYQLPKKEKVYSEINGGEIYVDVYKMFDTRTKELVGTMKAAPIMYSNKNVVLYSIPEPYKSFYISSIKVEDKGVGHGSAFINLAKAESKINGCQGRVHLVASRIFSPNNPPHLFYRKKGFASESSYIDSTMDFFISMKKQLPLEYADNVAMYLPLKDVNVSLNSRISKIFKFIKEKFAKI